MHFNEDIVMSQKEEHHVGFVVRAYSCYSGMKDYAGIICDICESPEEAADAIVEHLKAYSVDADEEELSEEQWNAVREKISKDFFSIEREFKPERFVELENRIVPESIKINKILLSDRLVRRIREGTPTLTHQGR